MDGRFSTKPVKEMYQHSFRNYLEKWTEYELEEQPAPLNQDPELDDYQENRLDDLRFGIKKDRDKNFVEEIYEELEVESVPKSFWLTDYELEHEQTEMDEFAQTALSDYRTD